MDMRGSAVVKRKICFLRQRCRSFPRKKFQRRLDAESQHNHVLRAHRGNYFPSMWGSWDITGKANEESEDLNPDQILTISTYLLLNARRSSYGNHGICSNEAQPFFPLPKVYKLWLQEVFGWDIWLCTLSTGSRWNSRQIVQIVPDIPPKEDFPTDLFRGTN